MRYGAKYSSCSTGFGLGNSPASAASSTHDLGGCFMHALETSPALPRYFSSPDIGAAWSRRTVANCYNVTCSVDWAGAPFAKSVFEQRAPRSTGHQFAPGLNTVLQRVLETLSFRSRFQAGRAEEWCEPLAKKPRPVRRGASGAALNNNEAAWSRSRAGSASTTWYDDAALRPAFPVFEEPTAAGRPASPSRGAMFTLLWRRPHWITRDPAAFGVAHCPRPAPPNSDPNCRRRAARNFHAWKVNGWRRRMLTGALRPLGEDRSRTG